MNGAEVVRSLPFFYSEQQALWGDNMGSLMNEQVEPLTTQEAQICVKNLRRLEQQVSQLLEIELGLRESTHDLRQKLHNAEERIKSLQKVRDQANGEANRLRSELCNSQKANTKLVKAVWDIRNCENCTMQGCNNKEDETIDIACVNNDHDKWEFAQHQPLAYDVHQELRSAQKTTKQRSNQIQAMRNCENCNERGCGDNENIGIACMNNNRDKWEFEP